MRVLSLFSGVGGMDLGLEAAGHTIVAQCELGYTTDADGKRTNTYAREILCRHWPDVPLHDDVTTLNPKEFRGRVDLVAGGSPCQDLSVAGRRGGLDGARSGLFWHQCRIADQTAAPWVLWENVAGAFSSNNGADFAAVLWGLTGALPDVPDGGWRTAGVVVGPKRTAVWRLLDARWFGVAQRRRRVFVVAGPRGACGPEVLLEPEGVRGNPEPSRQAGQEVTAAADERTLGRHFVGTVTTNCAKGIGSQNVQEGFAIPTHTGTVTANWSKGPGNTQVDEGHVIAVPQAVSENQRGEVLLTPYSRQLTTGGGKPGQGYPRVAVPIDMRNAARSTGSGAGTQGDGIGEDGDPMFTLTGNTMGRPAVATSPAYSVAVRGRDGGSQAELGEPDTANTLRVARSQTVLTPTLEVRRLTPLECERLMGWPDDHTRWGVTESGEVIEVADSHRYRACGNGVVAPVAEWIGRRQAVAS